MGKDNEFSSRTADEDTELYAIESIVGKRIIRGKVIRNYNLITIVANW